MKHSKAPWRRRYGRVLSSGEVKGLPVAVCDLSYTLKSAAELAANAAVILGAPQAVALLREGLTLPLLDEEASLRRVVIGEWVGAVRTLLASLEGSP